ncbi:hypothetical protein EVAR_61567_1 [Eumeta japonica]|uniref:Uncharacterized protein n=1 Tax=Eumeta variegata TaxID=151549 RepID=A0A4C1YQM1_EUMVA|nr:hypothetical protein EVAR_61567_1 [Eumeta japonica]
MHYLLIVQSLASTAASMHLEGFNWLSGAAGRGRRRGRCRVYGAPAPGRRAVVSCQPGISSGKLQAVTSARVLHNLIKWTAVMQRSKSEESILTSSHRPPPIDMLVKCHRMWLLVRMLSSLFDLCMTAVHFKRRRGRAAGAAGRAARAGALNILLYARNILSNDPEISTYSLIATLAGPQPRPPLL